MTHQKKLFILAGEASGDLHGSNLVKSLFQQDSELIIKGWGGDQMSSAGVELLKTIDDLSFMGFAEVVLNIKTILTNFKDCKKQILSFNPDAVILIDYPGFNLRMAKWLKKRGIKVIYYISPQIWAWKEKRVETIKKYVDRMMVILPFEKDFYKKHGLTVDYVGHPLLEAITNTNKAPYLPGIDMVDDQKLVVLLPGSRRQEIKSLLPVMLNMVNKFEAIKFVIAAAPSIPKNFYESILNNSGINTPKEIEIINKATYRLLARADAALVCSGTATLETALFEVPQVVCYKANPISYAIAKRLIKVKYISLVNLIMDKPFLTELIQSDFNEDRLQVELAKCLNDEQSAYFKSNYQLLKDMLKVDQYASDKASEIIFDVLK